MQLADLLLGVEQRRVARPQRGTLLGEGRVQLGEALAARVLDVGDFLAARDQVEPRGGQRRIGQTAKPSFGLQRARGRGACAAALAPDHRRDARGEIVHPALGLSRARLKRGELPLERRELRVAARLDQLALQRGDDRRGGAGIRPVEGDHHLRSLHLHDELLLQPRQHPALAADRVDGGREVQRLFDSFAPAQQGPTIRFPVLDQAVIADGPAQLLVGNDHLRRSVDQSAQLAGRLPPRAWRTFQRKREQSRVDVIDARQERDGEGRRPDDDQERRQRQG